MAGIPAAQAAPAGHPLLSPFRCRVAADAPPQGRHRPDPAPLVGAGGEAPRHRRCRFPPLSCRFPRRRRLRSGLDRHAKAAAGWGERAATGPGRRRRAGRGQLGRAAVPSAAGAPRQRRVVAAAARLCWGQRGSEAARELCWSFPLQIEVSVFPH